MIVPELSTKPGSSTAKQRSTLVVAGKRRGLSLAEIRKMVGGSIKQLSAAKASDWITHYTGRELPNPPGQKPSPYKGKPPARGTVRMIAPDHVEQIQRLGEEYFAPDVDGAGLVKWLRKNFKVDSVHELGTAERAGEVIAVLKQMLTRRQATTGESCDD